MSLFTIGAPQTGVGYFDPGFQSIRLTPTAAGGYATMAEAQLDNLLQNFEYDPLTNTVLPQPGPGLGANGPGGWLDIENRVNAMLGGSLPFAAITRSFANPSAMGLNNPLPAASSGMGWLVPAAAIGAAWWLLRGR